MANGNRARTVALGHIREPHLRAVDGCAARGGCALRSYLGHVARVYRIEILLVDIPELDFALCPPTDPAEWEPWRGPLPPQQVWIGLTDNLPEFRRRIDGMLKALEWERWYRNFGDTTEAETHGGELDEGDDA